MLGQRTAAQRIRSFGTTAAFVVVLMLVPSEKLQAQQPLQSWSVYDSFVVPAWAPLDPIPPVAAPASPSVPPPAGPVSNQTPSGKGNEANRAASTEASGANAGKGEDKKNEPSDDQTKEFKEERFNIFGQSTVISNWNGPFNSPYLGPHSFQSISEAATSETATLDLGLRLFGDTELYFDPEIAGGRGLSDVFGIAAFPNGDITRVGNVAPTPYVARLYVNQTIGFGGEQEKIEAGPNQLAEMKDISRLTIAVGKMAVTDFFDNNKYSHDPRSQFMNWALMYNAAYDYPADVRGYTYGGVVEFNQKNWAVRYGLFGEPSVANGSDIDPNFGKAHGQVVEFEKRYTINDHSGKVRCLFYWNRADMGNYKEATDDPIFDLDIAATRSYSMKYGIGVNAEQEITKDLGGFLRAGWDDGHTETWAFTECDRTCAFGLTLKGTSWCRSDDAIGSGLAIDGLSGPHAEYLAAGGLGFELGDGKLDYAPEIAWESYYDFKFKNHSIWITPDVQLIADPGYNRDRGPVVIGAVRLHAEF